MTAKEIVQNFYKSDVLLEPNSVKNFLHPDVVLEWRSSTGFKQLNYNEIIRKNNDGNTIIVISRGIQCTNKKCKNDSRLSTYLVDNQGVNVGWTPFFDGKINRNYL